MFFWNSMEPKLSSYRLIMAIGGIGFLFSFKAVYFPTGWVCIASGIFTAFYLWEELICSSPSRDDIVYEEPSFLGFGNILKPTPIDKLFLFLIMPFIVWHIMAFGMGYIGHRFSSAPVAKEYLVSAVLETKIRRTSVPSTKFKDFKTYRVFTVKTPIAEYEKIKGKKNLMVEIDSYTSIFGTSLDKNFKFNKIEQAYVD